MSCHTDSYSESMMFIHQTVFKIKAKFSGPSQWPTNIWRSDVGSYWLIIPKYNVQPLNSFQDIRQNHWTMKYRSQCATNILRSNIGSYWLIIPKYGVNTGHSRYFDFAYLDTTTYVEVIFHSQHCFSIFLCISTPSMLKMVNMKQWVSRDDFLCPSRIFYYICYCLCRSKHQRSHGRDIVCFGYVHVLAEVWTSSKQQ